MENRNDNPNFMLMYEYHLDLTGLHTVLRTPDPIQISDRLQPFLCPPQGSADCAISVQHSHSLPPLSPHGVWHGPAYYDCHGDTMRVFHCSQANTEPIAVTQLDPEGNIIITVLPGYTSWFAGSAGIFNRIGMETLLLRHNGLLLHASLIKYAHQGIALAGPSGVGKSTQASLWQDSLGAKILNGDRAAIRRTKAGWIAYGSPYAGTSGIYCKDSAPLKAIVVLQQARENRLHPLTPTQALTQLYPQLSVHHWDQAFVSRAADLCMELLAQVPVYLLECVPEQSAPLFLKKGLDL